MGFNLQAMQDFSIGVYRRTKTVFEEVGNGLYQTGFMQGGRKIVTVSGLEKLTKEAIAVLKTAELIPSIGATAVMINKRFSRQKDFFYATLVVTAIHGFIKEFHNWLDLEDELANHLPANQAAQDRLRFATVTSRNKTFTKGLLAISSSFKTGRLIQKYTDTDKFSMFTRLSARLGSVNIGGYKVFCGTYNPLCWAATRPDDFFGFVAFTWSIGFAIYSWSTDLHSCGRREEVKTKNLLERVGDVGKDLLITLQGHRLVDIITQTAGLAKHLIS